MSQNVDVGLSFSFVVHRKRDLEKMTKRKKRTIFLL